MMIILSYCYVHLLLVLLLLLLVVVVVLIIIVTIIVHSIIIHQRARTAAPRQSTANIYTYTPII